MYDVIIIGGGVSGLAAGLYAKRFKLKTLILAERLGGLIQDANWVENYPGFKRITGATLAKMLLSHAKSYGVEVKEEKVIDVKREREFLVKTSKKEYKSRALILATGSIPRRLDVPGEKEFLGKGVSYCALCDGLLFKDKVVGVVGGSDSAVKEALLLSQYAKRVFIIYRGEKLRAEPINLSQIKKIKKVEVITNTNVKQIVGESFLTGVVLDKPYKREKLLRLDGLFIKIGREPNTALAKNLGARLNKKGEIIVNKNSETNIRGVFAAGDCTDNPFKQAITGVAQGVVAAFGAYKVVGF